MHLGHGSEHSGKKQIMPQFIQREKQNSGNASSSSQETKSMMKSVLDESDLILQIRTLNYELDKKDPLVEATKDFRVKEIISNSMSYMKISFLHSASSKSSLCKIQVLRDLQHRQDVMCWYDPWPKR